MPASAVTTIVTVMTPVSIVVPLAVTERVVVVPVIGAAEVGPAEAALETPDVVELGPRQAPVMLQRRVAVPVAKSLVALQPARHVMRAMQLVSRIMIRRRLVQVANLLVRSGLGRIQEHEATGDQCCCNYLVHNVLRFVPVQLQGMAIHMNRE